MRNRRSQKRAGLSLVEVVSSTLLVGVVLVGALNCLGAVIQGRLTASNHVKAQLLAGQLMAEILANPYQEPDEVAAFGREPSEAAVPRSGLDDVDDYDAWSSSPPVDQTGVALPEFTNWQRDVTVEWVDPANPDTVVGVEQGAKRITVTVQRNGKVLARRVAVRTDQYRLGEP